MCLLWVVVLELVQGCTLSIWACVLITCVFSFGDILVNGAWKWTTNHISVSSFLFVFYLFCFLTSWEHRVWGPLTSTLVQQPQGRKWGWCSEEDVVSPDTLRLSEGPFKQRTLTSHTLGVCNSVCVCARSVISIVITIQMFMENFFRQIGRASCRERV